MMPNPDHLLGFARFVHTYQNLEVAEISLAFHAILTEHETDTALITDYEGPADAIYTLLQEWFEIEE